MPYEALPLHKAEKIGRHAEATIMWDAAEGECAGGPLHVARIRYADGYEGSDIPDGWRDQHPTSCDRCGATFDVDADHKHSGSMRWEWNTPTGQLEPGCAHTSDPTSEHGDDGHCYLGWSNCDGRHHHVVLPNGHPWVIESRASNCGLPDDTTHRCWVFEGDLDDPSTWNVSKEGETCAAGAGSILSGDYHGFLQHGTLTAG